MTIYAVDEETGVMGTYQAALAKRGKACTLGLLRDVDANKILAILSIQGATRNMEAKMKLQAQNDAERKLWNLESLNKLNLAKEDEPSCIKFPSIRYTRKRDHQCQVWREAGNPRSDCR